MKLNRLKKFIASSLIAAHVFSFAAISAASAAEKTTLGAFEITAAQRDLAKKNTAGYPVLDAGRGNPNWINAKARLAFARLTEFAVGECKLVLESGDMAGQAKLDGIGARFDAAMDASDATDAFLIKAVDYCTKTLGMNKDEVVKELVDGIVGCYYPTPSRVLKNTEKILNAYLASTILSDKSVAETTKVFPTEGGSAAMCYIFDALEHNEILKPGDKIAIGTPIFTPYLQIPSVKNYGLVGIDLESTEANGWDMSDAEVEKLANPEIKAFFLVNPSNPASRALSKGTIEKIKLAVAKNPELIILTDDVYGTFSDGFASLYGELPYNTMLVYSFSKLYGVTGWRVGLLAMNENNVLDALLKKLPQDKKDFLHKEYSIVTTEPEKLPFVERVTADSRSIGLYHTSGLSTPQQVFMDILALTHLVDEGNDAYINTANNVTRKRYELLMNSLGLEPNNAPENARYYALIDLNTIAEKAYGEEFAKKLDAVKGELEILNDLAAKKGVVLMYGPGFDTPDYYTRVSLANLNEEDYAEIARRINELISEYHAELTK